MSWTFMNLFYFLVYCFPRTSGRKYRIGLKAADVTLGSLLDHRTTSSSINPVSSSPTSLSTIHSFHYKLNIWIFEWIGNFSSSFIIYRMASSRNPLPSSELVNCGSCFFLSRHPFRYSYQCALALALALAPLIVIFVALYINFDILVFAPVFCWDPCCCPFPRYHIAAILSLSSPRASSCSYRCLCPYQYYCLDRILALAFIMI